MEISRRSFLKASGAAVAGAYAGLKLGFPEALDFPSFFEEGAAQSGSGVEDYVPTTCWVGKQDCGMLARRINGRVVKLEGHPDHPRNRGTLCPKGAAQLQAFYDPNRVRTPLKRTNAKGVPGEWQEISWDEALDLVVKKMKEALDEDPKYLVWQKGRSKAKPFYDKAFVKATGATKLHHGAFCSDTGYRALEYTWGTHAVLHPDMRDCNYLLAWGWNVTNAGGNKLCWLTWPRQLVAAKERGLKVVDIDPRLRSAAHFADEWLAIKPGTDLALALAICHRLITQGYLDEPYLKKYTNATFLVKADGNFSRLDSGDGEKEQLWDLNTNGPVDVTFNEDGTYTLPDGVDPALTGEYTVDGETVRPGFQVFKEYVAGLGGSKTTVEWAADICGLDAAQIDAVADEYGANAKIGATVEREGLTLPYRPVGIMAYHMAQQDLGFQALRTMCFIPMLVGAVGAVGGQQSDFTWSASKVMKYHPKFNSLSVKDETNLYLKDSKFYPINSNNSSLVARVLADPAKWGVDYDPTKAVFLLHHVNPMGSFPDRQANEALYQKLNFVAVLDPWLSRTADHYANVVLPVATIEKYEGPISATDSYDDAKTMRLPPMEPLFESRGEIDIYLDLCEKLGSEFLATYIATVNKELKLTGTDQELPTDTKPTPEQFLDAWCRMEELEGGLDYFRNNGVWLKGPVAASKYYGAATDYAGMIHRFYGESLLKAGQEMKVALKAENKTGFDDEIFYRDYTPLPTWRDLTLDGSPSDYDLYLLSHKYVEFKQSRTPIPLTLELMPEATLEINPATAKAKGIDEGGWVKVESHNALTGDVRSVKIRATYRESIRPDTVSMPHHFGEYVKHPWVKGSGPTPNELFFTGPGYVVQTADQTFCVKVKVAPTGGD